MSGLQIQPIFQLVRGAANRGALIEALQGVPVTEMDRSQLGDFLSEARKVERALARVDTEGAKRFSVAVDQLRNPNFFKNSEQNQRIALALLIKAFAGVGDDFFRPTRFAEREVVTSSLREALRKHQQSQQASPTTTAP